MRHLRSEAMLLVATAFLSGACGSQDEGDEDGAATGPSASGAVTGGAAPSCPPAEQGGFSGSTSEGLCVTFGLEGSKVSGFELEIMISCTLGFGEGSVQLGGEEETITSSEAAFDAGQPFPATVTIDRKMDVEAAGSFAAGGLSGTITGGQAEGSYELAFEGALIEDFTCSGGPVTWTASQS